ncbi:1-acyl-sn-glycerol-3-phosphate acyltransferase [Novosphingobium sp. PC22D]|uniref:lysophospholipid acyltransferase family protein n=1 Tax=Novosphingobium sp. PC22D TaxID=1962403 RepID=UPI000BF13FD2|nr:lysophospholipid acyltransferase family protein [Novosphingobium sp. PC22D]PEQ13559.1 1-acyl-sn-glycerol-3-phosphate acyltransferase [Novosphingobium sp. PC22D]
MKAGPGDVMRTLLFSVCFYGATVPMVLASLVAMPFGGETFRGVVERWAALHRWCARHILGIEVVVEGRIPQGGVLVALKHESFLEAIELPLALSHPAIFAKVELLRIPLWGRAAAQYGVVAVERDQGAKALRKMIAAAREHIAAGRPLAIFPEGTRVPHGERKPLGAGFAGLYKLLALPVVPVAIDSGPLYQRRWKKPGRITYRVGETIPPGLARPVMEARVLDAINALNPPGG